MYVMPNGELEGICEHPGNYGAVGGYDDGLGFYGPTYEAYGLSGIFGTIGKGLKSVGKAIGGVAKGAVKVAGKGIQLAAKVAPVAVAFIPGVGIPAAAAITGGLKLASGVTKKEKIGTIARDTIIGGAEGAAAGTVNKLAFKGQGIKGAANIFKKQPATADTAKTNLLAAGKRAGFGKKLPMVAPSVTTLLPEGGFPAFTLPKQTPDSDITPRAKKQGTSLISKIGSVFKSGGKTVAEAAGDAVVAATGTAAGGIPFSGGGGGAPGLTPDAGQPEAAVQEAGLLSGNMLPLLLVGGAALLLSGGGRRARR